MCQGCAVDCSPFVCPLRGFWRVDVGSDLKRWHVRFEQTPSCGTFAGVPLLVWRVCFRSRRTPVVRAECTVLCRGHGALWVAGVVLALSPHHSCSRWHSVLALRSCSVLQSFSSSLLLCGTAFWLFALALCCRVLALRFCSVLQSFSSSLLLCGTAFWLFALALCCRVLALRFCSVARRSGSSLLLCVTEF